MRHKGFLSSAGDACATRARQSKHHARAQLASESIAGPSRRPFPVSSPSCSSSPSPPPIPPWPLPIPPTTASSSTSAASTLPSTPAPAPSHLTSSSLSQPSIANRRSLTRHIASASASSVFRPLSFLYPPSCLELTRRTGPTASTSSAPIRLKSSLAPTSVVSAATAAQQLEQLAEAQQDHGHSQHLSQHHLDPEFTFLRHQYAPPRRFFDHPTSNVLLQRDAVSHLEDQPDTPAPRPAAINASAQQKRLVDHQAASAAFLASLRRQSQSLRRSLQTNTAVDPATIEAKCRRLVLQSWRIKSRLHARSAHAIVYHTISDCSLYLSASGQPVTAANIIRHLLVKLGWNPRCGPDPDVALPSTSGASAANSNNADIASTDASLTAGTRLALIAQQVISQLTLAPSTSSPRPTRRFESTQHLDAAVALVSAMHLTQMPRPTATQTALIRAMIASGHSGLAVQSYIAEVRAWWGAHKEAKRLRSPLRRQAALVVQLGTPSSQALREITRALQHVQELLSRIRPDILAELPDRERQALSAKRSEYADSLVDLIRLVRGGRLPLPSAASTPEITWILSACCRFESTTLLNHPVATDAAVPGFFSPSEKRSLQGSAQVIRYYLREYMQSLPDGQTRSAGNLTIDGQPVVRPALGIVVYNQLIHYALSVLKSASICKEVFQHMTQFRHPPLQPDSVTFNTILRQATTQRYESLSRAVLITEHAERSPTKASDDVLQQNSAIDDQRSTSRATNSSTAVASASASAPSTRDAALSEIEPRPVTPMIQQIDTAIAQADSYRLVALLQYVTASGLFLRRFRHEPGHAGVKELVMRIYPALNIQRFARRPSAVTVDAYKAAPQPGGVRRLRPKANQASRHAILNPHVLTATLNLAAKAGKTGLALRIWRLLKRTSLQSALQSPTTDVAKTPWKIPVEAATVLMQVFANEAARAPKVKHASRSSNRLRTPLGASRSSMRRAASSREDRKYARGWNIFRSLRSRSNGGRLHSVGGLYGRIGDEMGEGLRWRAAHLLAKREYAFLVHHWQLSRTLLSWRRKRVEAWLQPEQRGEATLTPPKRPTHVLGEKSADPQPDSRFYDALLGVFGRRPGMVQRSRRHSTRSEVLYQLRRGFEKVRNARAGTTARASESPNDVSATVTATATATGTSASHTLLSDGRPLHMYSTDHLLQAVVSRITFNSRGRWTSLPPDTFLVRILIDMEALGIDIPVAYRWILAYCFLHSASQITTTTSSSGGGGGDNSAASLLQNDQPGQTTNSCSKGGRRSRKSTGAFSAFRGPRIKTVGLIARRPNSATIGNAPADSAAADGGRDRDRGDKAADKTKKQKKKR